MPTTHWDPPDPRQKFEELNKDFSTVFGSPAGRRILEHLERTYFVNSPLLGVITDAQGRIDTHRMSMAEGQRALVLSIRKRVEAGSAGPHNLPPAEGDDWKFQGVGE